MYFGRRHPNLEKVREGRIIYAYLCQRALKDPICIKAYSYEFPQDKKK